MPPPPLPPYQQPTRGGTTLGRKGFTVATLFPSPLAATRYRVGLQVSYIGVGAMLNPIIARPLTESAGKSHSKKTQRRKIEKKQRKTYREVSGTTLKARPNVDGPAGQGPLPDCDPRPLSSAGGGVIPTGSCLA